MAWLYIVTIEGIAAGGNGIAKYCGPGPKPGYGGAAYFSRALAEVPSGASAQWDILRTAVSSGRFSMVFRPYQSDGTAGPINFQATRARAVTELRAEVNDTVLQFPVRSESTVSGIVAGSIVYLERETLLVDSVIDGSSPVFNVLSRGYAGSTAASHGEGADCFLVPPAMTGRKIEVFEVNTATATSDAGETKILQGYISGEVGAGLHWPTFAAVSEFATGRFNPEPEGVDSSLTFLGGGRSRFAIIEQTGPPRYHESGGYWYVPKLKAVWPAQATQAGAPFSHYNWEAEAEPLFALEGEPITPSELSSGPYQAYQIAYSNREGAYAPFIDSAGDTSEHPIDIALCLICSKGTGSAGTNGDWDLGSAFAADACLGVDVSQVDTDQAERLKAQMPGIRASEFWFGGEESETPGAVLERLLAPWGIAVGRNMVGTYKFLRLSDVYPDDASTALTTSNLIGPENWRQTTQGRALDSVVIHVDHRPGEEGTPQTVTEVSTRRYYSGGARGVIIGDREEYRNSPYNSADLVEDSAAWTMIASRIRRLSDRVAFLDVEVGPSVFGTIDLGDGVTINDPGIRSPVTGDRLRSTDQALKGTVTSLQPDYSKRTMRIRIALTDTGNVCLIAPSATVASWNSSTNTATVNDADWTASNDAGAFAVGDVCVLLSSDLLLESDDGTGVQTTIDSIGTNTITFDSGFSAGGFGVLPNSGDVITLAHYDVATSTMKDSGYLGRDGATPADPVVGTAGDEVYTFGDY